MCYGTTLEKKLQFGQRVPAQPEQKRHRVELGHEGLPLYQDSEGLKEEDLLHSRHGDFLGQGAQEEALETQAAAIRWSAGAARRDFAWAQEDSGEGDRQLAVSSLSPPFDFLARMAELAE